MAWRERLGDLREALEERTGLTIESRERLDILEARSTELGATRRELDALAWTALDYVGGAPQELKAIERRKLTQKARIVWMKDPQAGAAVDLMNDFVFGRGLPKPKANDPAVQDVIDEAWDDPDNQLVLTSYQAQLALGTDLTLQSNLFVLMFDDGEDGRVKLGLLDHDAVENVVRDPDNRLRVMFFMARHFKQEWDFDNDCPKNDLRARGTADAKYGDKGKGEVRYYEHWRNVQDAKDDADAGLRDQPKTPPPYKMGDGKVFHIALNRTSEMGFGHPVMDRLLRWYTAYNSFIDARLDIMQAKAAFVMKQTVKGTPSQLAKMAQQAVSRRSALGAAIQDPDLQGGPRPASILRENESVKTEDVSLDTAAGNAATDAQMIRSQVSAATRFPQSYYGDPSNSTLATATSLELPVLKAVESRQEFFESLVRFFIDRVIERAVDAGRLEASLTPEEVAAQSGDDTVAGPTQLGESHEDKHQDEADTERDLGYEFSMPNPLRRLLTDLTGAIQSIAQTFDPNNTNPELSRVLLTIALGEGLEVEDPAGAVERIFPPGYVDPAIAAAQQAPPGGGGPFGEFGPQGQGVMGADGQQHTEDNAYGAPQRAQSPEQTGLREAVTRGRDGGEVIWLREARAMDRPSVKEALDARRRELDEDFDEAGGVPDASAGNNSSSNGNGRNTT